MTAIITLGMIPAMKKPELSAPAGNLENAQTALLYGADAMYQGWEGFSLRSGKKAEVTQESIQATQALAKAFGKKYYLALNIFAHNEDIDRLQDELRSILSIPVDAYIISDPGVMTILKEQHPRAIIHLSTQANTLNYASVRFWRAAGVQRIILARELHEQEIRRIQKENPEMELEIFVHGAMCMAYAGRCNLSLNFLGRDSNKGDCSHVCRWKFDVIDDGKSKEMEMEEVDGGIYILNSSDLNLAPYISTLLSLGLSSLKIEGRNKTSYYVANVTRVYRHLIDEVSKLGSRYQPNNIVLDELNRVSHRQYSAGFFQKDQQLFNFKTSAYEKDYKLVGVIKSYKNGQLVIQVRDKIETGETVEIIMPDMRNQVVTIQKIMDIKTGKIIQAAHNSYEIAVDTQFIDIQPGFLVRKVNRI